MSALATALAITGSLVAVLAGIGLLRFHTTYARLHAAGKASPIAFIIAGAGASLELGVAGGATLAVAGAAMVLTLPVGVHLLFRAVHRSSNNRHLVVDDLARAEQGRPPTDLDQSE